MNIFFLDYSPEKAAEYHCDKHVVKMIIETAQLLCNAHHWYKSEIENCYAQTHVSHPCSIWVRKNDKNYYWAWALFYWLSIQYTRRYRRVHATTERLLANLMPAPEKIPFELQISSPAQAMPDEYRHVDPVIAYRNYYLGEKARFAKWNHSQKPWWWIND